MSRMYAVGFQNKTIVLDQDLFWIAPVANKPIALHALYISQVSQIQDAEEEMWRMQVIRGLATVGSVGASSTSEDPGVPEPDRESLSYRRSP